MADRATGAASAKPGKRPLLARLRGWLAGDRKAPTAPRAPPAEGASQASPAVPPLSRMTVAQWLWGDGYLMPGGPDFVLELVKPFGLTPAMSTLDLSAGLGGPARAIAQTFGTYVT